jgi:hypothetical protein
MNRPREAKALPALDSSWRKSTRSQGNGACVEVRFTGLGVEVRDTKDRTGPVLSLTPAQWTMFIDAVASGELTAPKI